MDEMLIPGKDDEGQLFRQFISQYDAPSYIRRARAVEVSYEQLLEHCRQEREKMLNFVRLHLATLKAQAGTWEALNTLVAPEVRQYLEQWYNVLQPTLRLPVSPTTSTRTLQNTLDELRESLLRFNQRWQNFLNKIDLTEVNRIRESYNKYYILEKECALRNSRLARQGYHRLSPLSTADLLALLPLLEIPGFVGQDSSP
jgi:hypothetical protein